MTHLIELEFFRSLAIRSRIAEVALTSGGLVVSKCIWPTDHESGFWGGYVTAFYAGSVDFPKWRQRIDFIVHDY